MKKIYTFLNVTLAFVFAINVIISRGQSFGLNPSEGLNLISLNFLTIIFTINIFIFFFNLINKPHQLILHWKRKAQKRVLKFKKLKSVKFALNLSLIGLTLVNLFRLSQYKLLFSILTFIFGFITIKQLFSKKKPIKKIGKIHFKLSIILIFSIFILARVYLLTFKGNYPDEYNHIISGIHLFEKGSLPKLVKYTDSWKYTRGTHMSFLTGIFMKLIGQKLWVAKLAPLTLGCLNFYLLYKISKFIIESYVFRSIYLLLFSLSPWIIFNHNYIRGYVFTEFSLIFMVFLGLKGLEIMNQKPDWFRFLSTITMMSLVTYVNYQFSNDKTAFIIPISMTCQSGYLLLSFYNQKLKQSYKHLHYFLSFLILIGLSLIFAFNKAFFLNKINMLINGTSNTGSNHLDFMGFFGLLNTIPSIFTIMSILISFTFKDDLKKIFFVGTIPLLGLHAISNKDLQVLRGLVYIFPLFYMSSFIAIEKLRQIKPSYLKIGMLTFLSLNYILILINDYKLVFGNGYPSIPYEVAYHEYSKQYEFLKNLPKNTSIYVADYNNQREHFFDVTVDYMLDFTGFSKQTYSFYEDNKNITKQLFTQTPVLEDFNRFIDLTSSQNACVIIKPFSQRDILGEEVYNYILNNFKLTSQGIGFKIFCN